jgi:anti-sigma regulatory factor (Ser/Thr protein kinase)
MKKTFNQEIESKLENLPVIANFVSNVMASLNIGQSTAYQVQLAIDEACTNVINYAYTEEGGPLTITIEVQADELVITVSDKGQPFDPLTVPPPDLDSDLEERKIGGLGIYFIKKLMDEVSYGFSNEYGNRLTMRKKLSQ